MNTIKSQLEGSVVSSNREFFRSSKVIIPKMIEEMERAHNVDLYFAEEERNSLYDNTNLLFKKGAFIIIYETLVMSKCFSVFKIIENNKGVAFLSLEMPAEEITRRLISYQTCLGVP